MREILLHIGHRKTATTTLQGIFAQKAGDLRKVGVFYPETGRTGKQPHHHHLAKSLMWKKYFVPNERFTCPEDMVDGILHEWSESKCPRMLISSEVFFENNTAIENSFFKRIPKSVRIKVIAYLREPYSYFLSDANMRIKWGGSQRSVAEQLAAATPFQKERLDFFTRIVGDENMIVRIFEPPKLHNADILDDFSVAADIPRPLLEDDVEGKESNANVSLDMVTLEFKRLVNKLSIPEKNKQELVLPLSIYSQKYMPDIKFSAVSAEERQEFIERFSEENSAICAKYFPDSDTLYQIRKDDTRFPVFTGISTEQGREILKFLKVEYPDVHRWLVKSIKKKQMCRRFLGVKPKNCTPLLHML